jgi:hypothetical protein
MKSKRNGINLLGAILVLVVLGIVVFSVFYLSRHMPGPRHGIRWRKVESWIEDDFKPWEKTEEERAVEDRFDAIDVQNISGTIAIQGWDREYTQIRIAKRGPLAEELEIVTDVSNRTLTVRPEYTSSIRKPFSTVSYDIKIPGEVHTITAKSTSGDVSVFGMGPWTDQQLKTVSGNIETDYARNLSSVTTSGSIRFRFAGKNLYAKTVSGSVSGDILDLARGGTCEVASTSGSITLNAVETLGANVTMKSTSGSVFCGLDLRPTLQKSNELIGIIGDGSGSISVRTTSGSIRMNGL